MNQDFEFLIRDVEDIKDKLKTFRDIRKQFNRDKMTKIKVELINCFDGKPIHLNIKDYEDEVINICEQQVTDIIDAEEEKLKLKKDKMRKMVDEM